MVHKTRLPILLSVLAVAAAASAFLLIRNQEKLAEAIFLNDQALYAEVAAGATQAFPPATATTTKIILPILVYHIVRPSYPSDDQAVRNLAQTPEVFDAQMQYLGTAGYHVVSFGDLENYFQKGTPLPKKPIIISFDDGWSDQFQYAFPVLKKYRYTATFFVFTNPIGTHGFLTWDNLRTLRDAGMTIASHSLSHPYLTKNASTAALWNEIYGSKQKLEKNLGVPVNEFAYPFGQYDATTTTMVQTAGYMSARGDYNYGKEQTSNRLFTLSALNVPTTTALFIQKF